jgi:soluble lytic murein transglycosylase-like protein
MMRFAKYVAGVPGIFALAIGALAIFGSSEPALAHHGYHHHAYHRLAWRRVTPAQADHFASGIYDYAPALQTRPNDRRQNGWGQNTWSENSWGQNNWGQSGFGQNGFDQSAPLDGMAAAQASANGVPVSLVERVIKRESGGNPRAVSRGNYGLMQIRLGTARAMGYSGSAAGLLDAQTNMTYAVRYLAGAYRAAGGNESRAVALYARGYYYQVKAQGFSPYAAEAGSGFAAYSPGPFQVAETFGDNAPVYRVRHRRHRAV